MGKIILSDDDFKKLVAQAKLVLTKDEEEKIKSQLDDALSAVQILKELDTQGVPTQGHPTGDLENVWREDLVTPSLPQDLALSSAPKSHQGYFVAKAVFDETS